MISADLIGADGTIDVVALHRDGAAEALGVEMSKALVAEADARGVVVHVDDVVIWLLHPSESDVKRNVRRFGAAWAPDPGTRGIEFYGGSHDGEVLTGVPRGDGPGAAFPPPVLDVMGLPVTEDFSDVRAAERPPQPAALVERYIRAGIDDTKRRFIYKIKV